MQMIVKDTVKHLSLGNSGTRLQAFDGKTTP